MRRKYLFVVLLAAALEVLGYRGTQPKVCQNPLSRFRVESTLSAFTMDEKLTQKDPKTLLYWRLKPG
jgi:hypothetical protein